MSLLSPLADVFVQVFREFQGPIIYKRDGIDYAMFGAQETIERTLEIVGDYTENRVDVRMVIQDLKDAGLWPPLKHDRIIMDDQERSIQDFRYAKVAEVQVFVIFRAMG